VIAIIAILASMLLPALSKSRAKAKQTFCVNNQKQLLLSLSMYIGDNNDFLPPQYDGDTNGTRWYQKQYLGEYFNADLPRITKINTVEVPVQGSIIHCPQSCNYSASISEASWIGYATQIFYGTVKANYLTGGPSLQEFKDPTKVVVFQDARTRIFQYASNYAYVSAPWNDSANVPDFRHSSGVNYSFPDGHVEFIKNPNLAYTSYQIFTRVDLSR
jgi:prepilin-type processing-associated H-X9-DG protein